MHIPDGVIGPGVSAAAGAVAAGGFGVAVSRSRRYLTDRLVPLAALVTAFVFAAQMINFPVLPGMSGHLLGGVMAAVLVGPWTGFIVIGIVLIIQALMFADGGLTALGLNMVNMALIGGVGGYAVYRVLFRIAGSRPNRVPAVAAVAAFISVPLAALGFVAEFALGGTAESLSLGAILIAMTTTHVLIGVGEGAITFFVVGAVMRARPDLVYGSPTFAGRRTEELTL
ncbi:MAG: energy-coupling factor ABC transporter permease [Actinomycetota bacterium]|nr:energy-coupling factor ABC transporter permease [Actinomycetota bacterium]